MAIKSQFRLVSTWRCWEDGALERAWKLCALSHITCPGDTSNLGLPNTCHAVETGSYSLLTDSYILSLQRVLWTVQRFNGGIKGAGETWGLTNKGQMLALAV